MRRLAVLVSTILLVAGCGWSPPQATPTTSADCGPGPTPDAVTAEFALLPPAPWTESSRGHTADCRMHWVVVDAGNEPDRLQQVLFFAGQDPVGSPTPEPRPYISVTPRGDHDAMVQYQWLQWGDEPCCPTGLGAARVTLEDGRLTILDPIPGP
ncbi:MAG: LppP/LprE family lipoprotein [Actinomycetota bacterium]|nr:LppP/LprE family lipoprotein [Actinomycetota bacterium]